MSENTYALALAAKYKGKTVEVLFDSDWGQQKWSDYDINNKPVLIGKFINATDNCIELEVEINTSSGGKVTKIIFINSWSVLSVSEYDGVSHIFAYTRQVYGKQ